MSAPACPVAAAVADAVAGRRGDRRWWVGLSGGLDSTVLLLALTAYRDAGAAAPPLAALHVHHGLHPAAERWSAWCGALCARAGVEYRAVRVAVCRGGRGLEAAAREARYAAFEDVLGPGEVLFLAHHLDDQAETVLLRLLRGAGARGLAGMPPHRRLGAGELLRPFLAVPRSALRRWAGDRGADWLEDPGNADPAQDRNFLRAEILPRLASRWPGYRETVARAADNLRAAPAVEAPPRCDNGWGDPGLALRELESGDALAALRAWLLALSCEPGPRAPLAEFLRQLRRAGGSPRLVGRGWALGRYREAIYLLPWPLRFSAPPARTLAAGDTLTVAGAGRIRIEGGRGSVTIAFRDGGERLRLPGGRPRRLKGLLQAAGVPPWWRERLPLAYAGGELVAAGGLWCAEGSAWRLHWDRSPVPRTAPD